MSRVLLVLNEDTLGGASRAVLRLIEILGRRGWDVHVWCTKPSALHDEVARMGLAVDGAPRLMRYRLRSLRHPPGVFARLRSLPVSLVAFRRHLRAQQPDLVLVNGRLALPEGIVARASGFPVVAYMHDDALPGARGLLARAAPWLVTREVLAVSAAHARSLRIGSRMPRVVPGGVTVPNSPCPTRKPAGGQVVVGTIGVPSPRKGTDLFVEMAERLRAAGAQVDVRIAGAIEDAAGADWAREQIRRGEVAGVRHLGHIDVARELCEWDIMVMPSRADPFPLAVLEAMAAGVAVVGVERDGIAEQLADGAGVLVAPEDAAALADAVLALVREPERRAALGAVAHQRVRERFTTDRSADRLEVALRAGLQRTGTR